MSGLKRSGREKEEAEEGRVSEKGRVIQTNHLTALLVIFIAIIGNIAANVPPCVKYSGGSQSLNDESIKLSCLHEKRLTFLMCEQQISENIAKSNKTKVN